MSSDDDRSARLDELTEVAYRLGLAFGQAAERAEDVERKIEFVHLFDRCFFSVRVAIGLQLRLRREARAAAGREDERLEAPERDLPDREPTERPDDRYDERDRDRESERATLPVLLRTLEAVAADAAALPGPPPADLPTLNELLAQVKGEPAPTALRPPASRPTALRHRLSGSAAALTLERPRDPRRGATGPP